jgi:hypothetical protein
MWHIHINCVKIIVLVLTFQIFPRPAQFGKLLLFDGPGFTSLKRLLTFYFLEFQLCFPLRPFEPSLNSDFPILSALTLHKLHPLLQTTSSSQSGCDGLSLLSFVAFADPLHSHISFIAKMRLWR